jgi:hypothetical protein
MALFEGLQFYSLEWENVAKTEVQKMRVETVKLITTLSHHFPEEKETKIPVRTAVPGRESSSRSHE